MATLATINGEAVAVPGLTFWGKRAAWGEETRIALICSDERGNACEVWTVEEWMHSHVASLRGLGGVEIHSMTPMHDFASRMDGCEIVPGGVCYADGSSLAYSEQFLPLIEAGNHAGVLKMLADWHRTHFSAA